MWIPGYIDEDLSLFEQDEVQSILLEIGQSVDIIKSKSILHSKNIEKLRNKSLISYEVSKHNNVNNFV